ncbi:hypothetical protein Ocin01_07425, partial [Orchesella cincta]
AHGIPLNATKNGVDQDFAQEYASIKHSLIYDLGYTEEFADLVEINLRRAVKEERERQKAAGILAGTNGTLIDLRQQGEDYEDEVTTPAGPTTPRASPADYVRGFAMIVTSLTQLNVRNFWGGFVNFFPPGQLNKFDSSIKMKILGIQLGLLLFLTQQASASPLRNGVQVDQHLAEKYAAIKQILVRDLGYTKEFADLVEVNLKKAIKVGEERVKAAAVIEANSSLVNVRQQEEDYEDQEVSTTPGTDLGAVVEALQQIEDYEDEVITTPVPAPLTTVASPTNTETTGNAQQQTEDYEDEVITTPVPTTTISTAVESTTPGVSPTENATSVDTRQQTEDYEDEFTTVAPSTTPGLRPTDILQGFGMIVMSLSQFNMRNFMGSFVNFFPAGQQREGAQALVDLVFAGQSGMTTVSSVKATTITAAVSSATAASAFFPYELPATVPSVIRAPPMRYIERVRTPSPGCAPNEVRVIQGLQGGVICNKL